MTTAFAKQTFQSKRNPNETLMVGYATIPITRQSDGKLVATVIALSNNNYELVDSNNNLLGSYDASLDATYDHKGTRLGYGNLLLTFL